MDLDISTMVNNPENNQLLLNAIKNKFATQSANETAAFSPPKLNIPCLKIPTNATEKLTKNTANSSANPQTTTATTPLNQFLIKQLQEQHKNKGLAKETTGFVLPQLQLGKKLATDSGVGTKFELPLLKSSSQTNISSLTLAINKLQVKEDSSLPSTSVATRPSIDLTTALASKLTHHGTPPTRDFNNKQNISEDFDIPFIECDRMDATRIILAKANEYCLTDISQLPLRPSNVEPSCIGRVLNFDNKFEAPPPLKCFSDEYQHQHVKHTIVPFQFDTKSPDDIVLEALSKYQRRYYN